MLQNIMPLACRSVFKESHSYFCQIQGLGQRPWCDFIVYTKKEIHVRREESSIREKERLHKLNTFFEMCMYCTRNCMPPTLIWSSLTRSSWGVNIILKPGKILKLTYIINYTPTIMHIDTILDTSLSISSISEPSSTDKC